MILPTIDTEHEAFLSEHFTLPPLPAVVQKLLTALQSGDTNAGAVAEILAADAGLVAQILKIVNSAYYGLPRRIAEVKHAVAYLGLSEIERVALTATVMKYFTPNDRSEFERFWHHSFYTTLISKRLAKKQGPSIEVEELHTAALLHDVGKLVYMMFFPDHYASLARYCRVNECLMRDAEVHFDLPSHSELGAKLCGVWRLPECVFLACQHHELDQFENLDQDLPHREELRLVCLANMLANLAATDLSSTHKDRLQDSIRVEMSLTHDEFLMLMGEVYEMKSDVEAFLGQL